MRIRDSHIRHIPGIFYFLTVYGYGIAAYGLFKCTLLLFLLLRKHFSLRQSVLDIVSSSPGRSPVPVPVPVPARGVAEIDADEGDSGLGGSNWRLGLLRLDMIVTHASAKRSIVLSKLLPARFWVLLVTDAFVSFEFVRQLPIRAR